MTGIIRGVVHNVGVAVLLRSSEALQSGQLHDSRSYKTVLIPRIPQRSSFQECKHSFLEKPDCFLLGQCKNELSFTIKTRGRVGTEQK